MKKNQSGSLNQLSTIKNKNLDDLNNKDDEDRVGQI